LVISFREGKFLSDFAKQLRVLRRKGLAVSVLFFEASGEILARRFSETRRPHPADRGKGLFDAIRAERTTMKRVRALADEVVDTSRITSRTNRTSKNLSCDLSICSTTCCRNTSARASPI